MIWSRVANYSVTWRYASDENMKIVDVPLSELDTLHAIDLNRLVETQTKNQVKEWVETNGSKRIWIIDRNDFYKSLPMLPEADRMKLTEVVLLHFHNNPPRVVSSE
jgi:tRNA splicing ligase